MLPRVFNFLRYRVGPGDAEELTGAVCEKAWAGRAGYRQDLAGFSTWLFTIARHQAIDHLRRRRDQTSLEENEAIDPDPTPEGRAALRSDVRRLRQLLVRLPERERELIALKYGAGMNNRAIARMTGLSESNVGTVLHRTVTRMRHHWTGGKVQ
jgi:RNA polymerase sigma-70 factor (ECF subfamily)